MRLTIYTSLIILSLVNLHNVDIWGDHMRTWLKELRGDRTQLEVAQACGISLQMYNFIENGHRRPSPEVAKIIGVELGFAWTKFYDQPDEPAATA
ncbi:MAG: helix-turn-helix transcriptional regulator [Bacillota bacterium]